MSCQTEWLAVAAANASADGTTLAATLNPPAWRACVGNRRSQGLKRCSGQGQGRAAEARSTFGCQGNQPPASEQRASTPAGRAVRIKVRGCRVPGQMIERQHVRLAPQRGSGARGQG